MANEYIQLIIRDAIKIGATALITHGIIDASTGNTAAMNLANDINLIAPSVIAYLAAHFWSVKKL